MSISTVYQTSVTTAETLNLATADAAKSKVTHGSWDTSLTLDANSSPAVTTFVGFVQALTSGAATIDLTALTASPFSSKSLSGKKVQIVKFIAASGNANPIVITPGASNGYLFLGTGCSVSLAAGQEFTCYLNNAAPTVGSGAKTIDLAGTGSQTLDCIFVA